MADKEPWTVHDVEGQPRLSLIDVEPSTFERRRAEGLFGPQLDDFRCAGIAACQKRFVRVEMRPANDLAPRPALVAE